MAVTHISTNTQDSAGALALTFTLGTHTTDDLMIAFVKQSENITQRTWDDDGGGGNGWTQLTYNRTTGGRDMECAIYYKFATSASETNPTFTWWSGGSPTEPMSGTVEIYRGVDTVEGITDFGYANATNDANPPNPSVDILYDTSTIVCFHGATHDDISTVAAPTGFTIRGQVWNGTADDHRNIFAADKIGHSGTGSYTPPDWQHSVLNTTPEYQTYTLVLPEVQPIHITGGTALDDFYWGDTNLTVTGDGFEATQATGKVEFWSDTSGTTKTTQTIDTWSDTSIQLDTVQGSLGTGTTVYLVVTNDSGDVSAKIPVNEGLLTYDALMTSLTPDHRWTLDDTWDDSGRLGNDKPMTSGVVGTPTFDTYELWEGATKCWGMDSVTLRREIADSVNMNVTISSKERTLMTTVELGGIQKSMSAIWKEGGGVQNLAFLVGQGNVLMWQEADVASTRDNVQAYSDFNLVAGRTYHITGMYSHLDTTKEARLYIDGVLQTVTDGNPMTTGIFDSHSGDVVWCDPDNNLEMGTADIAFAGQEDCRIGMFATWSDNSPNTTAGRLSDAEILLLARRSFPPHITIDSDTEANMQTDLDTYADTVRPNKQLCIRVEALSGGGDLELTADNITFDDAASVQLQYLGADTLTWVNTNGSVTDTDKFDTPAGGTITVVDRTKLTITGLPTSGVEVRIYADSGSGVAGAELDGAENVTSGSFETYLTATDDIIITIFDEEHDPIRELYTVPSSDVSLSLAPLFDRWYLNPETGGVDTYYFDGSDVAATETGSGTSWSNITNADDGSTTTDATVALTGFNNSKELVIEGTDASSSGTITQVRARMYGSVAGDGVCYTDITTDGDAEDLYSGLALPYSEGWSSYVTLSTPTGGWSWAKLQALETRTIGSADGSDVDLTLSRIEIEVTYT